MTRKSLEDAALTVALHHIKFRHIFHPTTITNWSDYLAWFDCELGDTLFTIQEIQEDIKLQQSLPQ